MIPTNLASKDPVMDAVENVLPDISTPPNKPLALTASTIPSGVLKWRTSSKFMDSDYGTLYKMGTLSLRMLMVVQRLKTNSLMKTMPKLR